MHNVFVGLPGELIVLRETHLPCAFLTDVNPRVCVCVSVCVGVCASVSVSAIVCVYVCVGGGSFGDECLRAVVCLRHGASL